MEEDFSRFDPVRHNFRRFLDFKHGLTGGLLWKGQHPEAETYYNSMHAR